MRTRAPDTTRSLFYDGGWHAARDGAVRRVRDPATGDVVGTSATASVADVDAAVEAATRAAPLWGRTHPDERGDVLTTAAALIEKRVEDIALLLTREQGKPLPDSRKEILFGASVLRYYAEEGRRLSGSLRPSGRPDVKSVVSWAPVGVVGAIVPWNYPVDLYCWKIGPALAAGNPVVAKPPVETPLAIGLVVQCLAEAGVPAGVLADLPGSAEAGDRLVRHPGVRMVSATASTATGQSIMRSAADGLKRLSLELGGQCPFVVLDDADVQEAAAAAARRAFSNAGQICIAVNRVLVAERRADDFVEALAAHAEAIELGHGVDDGVLYGPVLNQAVLDTSLAHVLDATAAGARLAAGGGPATSGDLSSGTFFRPTVIDHVPTTARVMREETFGPVVGVHRVASDADALRLANELPYGLAAYVYSQDLERAWAFADTLESGAVGININDVTELQAPFGGWKMSGFGRELGPEGLRAFAQQRHTRMRVRPVVT